MQGLMALMRSGRPEIMDMTTAQYRVEVLGYGSSDSRYTLAQEDQIVAEIEAGLVSKAQAARNLGLHPSCIRNMVKRVNKRRTKNG